MGQEDSPPKLQETPLMDGEMKNKVVDLSPFFLFEAVGDSEGDFDHQSMMMGGRLGDVHNLDDEDYDDGEDAESCSHDVWVHDTSHGSGNGAHGSTHAVVSHDNQHHYDDDDDIDGLKVTRSRESSWGCHDGDDGNGSHRKMAQSSRYDHDHNNNKSTSEVMSTANSHASRNSSCVDSCQGKKMSEKERSRLFWETCLAS